MKKHIENIIWIVVLTLFIICNWLMDWWMQNIPTTNGFMKNFFGLTISQSFHFVWYISMFLFIITITSHIVKNTSLKK